MRQDSITLDDVQGANHDLRPYLRLWASVMRLGIQDFCYARAAQRGEDDARVRWFYSRATDPGSFLWLCDLFSLDPDRARSKVLMNWRQHVDKAQGKDGD